MAQNPKPTFSVNIDPNPGKTQAGKSRPHGKGFIANPNTPERLQDIQLWSSTYTTKDGDILVSFTGTVDPYTRADSGFTKLHASNTSLSAPAVEVNGIKIEASRVVLFQAQHNEGNRAENGKRRADLYGYWNDNGTIIDVGAWTNDFEDGRFSAVGKTQPHFEKSADSIDASPEDLIGYGAEPDADAPASSRRQRRSMSR